MVLEKLSRVRPAASASRTGNRCNGTDGTDSAGNPAGTAPIRPTPAACRAKSLTTTPATSIATSAAGSRGTRRPDGQQHAEGRKAHGQRRQVGARQAAEELKHAREEALGLERDAEQGTELAEDDAERQPVHEADQDRPRQEIGDGAEAQQAGGQAHEPHEHGQHHRYREVLRWIASRERSYRGRDQGRGRRRGADDQLPRGAEHRVDHERQDAGVEPMLGRHPRELRIGDAHGHGDCRHGEAARHVVRQIGQAIVAQCREARMPRLGAGCGRWRARQPSPFSSAQPVHMIWMPMHSRMKAIRRTITSVPILPRRAITAAEFPKMR